jgi:hypothetical protein
VQIHTDHLIPGMVLDRDIELRAGSYLITCGELGEGCLTEKVIESIRKFSHQIVPVSHRIIVREDQIVLQRIRSIIEQDLHRIAGEVTSGINFPNYLADGQLEEKVMRVVEIMFSNPDLALVMYDARFNSAADQKPLELILDHSLRTVMLSLALGLRLNSTIMSMVSLGIAALLHDMGLLSPNLLVNLEALDDLPQDRLESFVLRHQVQSALFFSERRIALNPFQRNEIFHILANHHRPDPGDRTHKNTLLFYFADLVDEMISPLPHRLRYNFNPVQLETLGKSFTQRSGLISVLPGLARLYKSRGGQAWEITESLAAMFEMKKLLSSDYAEKLLNIMAWCPSGSALANPPFKNNAIPRTIYCGRSDDPAFSCEHMIYSRVEVQDETGEMKYFIKCGELQPRLQALNEGDDT